MLKANKFQSRFQNFLGDKVNYNSEFNSKSRNYKKGEKNDSQKNHTMSTNIFRNDTIYSQVNTETNQELEEKLPLIQYKTDSKGDKSRIMRKVDNQSEKTYEHQLIQNKGQFNPSHLNKTSTFKTPVNANIKNTSLTGHTVNFESRIKNIAKHEVETEITNKFSSNKKSEINQQNDSFLKLNKEERNDQIQTNKTNVKNKNFTVEKNKNTIDYKQGKSKKPKTKKTGKKLKNKSKTTNLDNNQSNNENEFHKECETTEDQFQRNLNELLDTENSGHIQIVKFSNFQDFDSNIEQKTGKEAKSFTYGFKDIKEQSFEEEINKKGNITDKKVSKIKEKTSSLKKMISIKPHKLKVESNINTPIPNEDNETEVNQILDQVLHDTNKNQNQFSKAVELKNKYKYNKNNSPSNSKY